MIPSFIDNDLATKVREPGDGWIEVSYKVLELFTFYAFNVKSGSQGNWWLVKMIPSSLALLRREL